MSAKRRHHETLETVLSRPWCYYCDRDFDDRKVLVDHQKAKHFHCQVGNCNRRLGTAGGLKVHMQQVHKEELNEVPNAMEGRRDPSVEIFAEVGIPVHAMESRIAAVTQYYQKLQRTHRLATGNPLPGEVPPEEASKPKRRRIEDEKDDIKARVKALTAKKAAEKAARAAGATLPVDSAPPLPPTTGFLSNGPLSNGSPSTGPATSPDMGQSIPAAYPPPSAPYAAYPVPAYPSNGSPIPPPPPPTLVNGGHGGLPGFPHPYPPSSSPVNFPPHPPLFMKPNYASPPPMHNGVNGGYPPSAPFGGVQRQQHSLPLLPPALNNRPPSLPEPPARYNDPGLPGYSMGSGSQAHVIGVKEDEMASQARANAKAEEFLSSFVAAQQQQAPSPTPAAPAAATPPPPPAEPVAVLPPPAESAAAAPPRSVTPQPASTTKPKSSSNGGDQMKLSDRITSWEEKRARAERYAVKIKSLTTVGAASDNITGPVQRAAS